MTHLCRYSWPGNVRQLEHSIERACILCEGTTISSEHLPEEVVMQPRGEQIPLSPNTHKDGHPDRSWPRPYTPTETEQQTSSEIIEALRQAGGNKAKAARILKIDRSTLYRKMRELHIAMDMFSN